MNVEVQTQLERLDELGALMDESATRFVKGEAPLGEFDQRVKEIKKTLKKLKKLAKETA